MQSSFSNRIALVTGGVRGIGRAIALAFAKRGCHVWVTGLAPEDVASFDDEGMSVIARQLDVSDENGVKGLVSEMNELDYLVNCAGVIHRDVEHDPAEFARVVDINLNGVMRVCSACQPLLIRRRGAVVNIASMLSFFGSGRAPAYSASKGGVVQLTKSLAIAWANDGVRINAVAPGWIETAMTAPLRENPQKNEAILRRTPLGRWGKPEDVAGAVLFLCSPDAAFITGVTLPIDGGYSIF